jgi:hypothetical protein
MGALKNLRLEGKSYHQLLVKFLLYFALCAISLCVLCTIFIVRCAPYFIYALCAISIYALCAMSVYVLCAMSICALCAILPLKFRELYSVKY